MHCRAAGDRLAQVAATLKTSDGQLKLIAKKVRIDGITPKPITLVMDGTIPLYDILLNRRAYQGRRVLLRGIYKDHNSSSESFVLTQDDMSIVVNYSSLASHQQDLVKRKKEAINHEFLVSGKIVSGPGMLTCEALNIQRL